MSKDKNQNDTPLDAKISGAVAALSSMKETLDQMTDPTLPDTVNDAMASLSAMSKALAQATDSSIPESLTAAADTLQYRLEKLPPMDYTGIMTDVVNTTESFYSNCFGKERLAEIFSMVKLFGDSPEVKGLQAMLDAYGRDGVINQEGVHAYINDFGRYWEHAAKAKDRDESAVPAQNLTIIKLISNPKKRIYPKEASPYSRNFLKVLRQIWHNQMMSCSMSNQKNSIAGKHPTRKFLQNEFQWRLAPSRFLRTFLRMR